MSQWMVVSSDGDASVAVTTNRWLLHSMDVCVLCKSACQQAHWMQQQKQQWWWWPHLAQSQMITSADCVISPNTNTDRPTGNMCVCWCSGGGGSCLQVSQSSVQLDCCYVLSPALSLHLFHSTAAVTWLWLSSLLSVVEANTQHSARLHTFVGTKERELEVFPFLQQTELSWTWNGSIERRRRRQKTKHQAASKLLKAWWNPLCKEEERRFNWRAHTLLSACTCTHLSCFLLLSSVVFSVVCCQWVFDLLLMAVQWWSTPASSFSQSEKLPTRQWSCRVTSNSSSNSSSRKVSFLEWCNDIGSSVQCSAVCTKYIQ